jgi:hypothetical protein
MALRIEKALGAITVAFLAAGVSQAAEFRYEALHDHLRKSGPGTLVIDDKGVSFKEKRGKHAWQWGYDDIQQLRLSPERLEVLTYRDNKWKFGADRAYEFKVAGDGLKAAHPFLKNRLDQRFVAVLADTQVKAIWQIPVKHRLRFGGSQGMLQFGNEAVVYSSNKRNESRTWRWDDIENITSSGPFDLTITTFERARSHYGDRKGFNFQLKQPLEEGRYNQAWQRVNQRKGLAILDSYRERNEKE